MPEDDAEKLTTGGKVPGGGADLGTRGRVSDEDLGETPEGTPGSDETATVPTRGRVPGTGTGLATAGRVGEEETYVAVAEALGIPASHPGIRTVEDPDKWKFKLFDVMLRRPGKDEISLLDQGLLMRVGDITKEFEQDYGQFAVSSVAINVSNLQGFLDTGRPFLDKDKPGGYFYNLSKDEIVEARVILKDTGESVFKGILSQKEEDFDIDTDEGVLELEGELKRYKNLSAEMMWQDEDPDDPHRFKSISAVVEKCREKMGIGLSQTVIEKPVLTGDEYSFSYYNRINKDEVVNSIAVDENGIVYQCTDHKIYSFDPGTEETKELYSVITDKLSNLLYYDGFLFYAQRQHGIDFVQIWKLKKDGTTNQFLIQIDFPSEIREVSSKIRWKWIGNGVPNIGYPMTVFIYETMGAYRDMGMVVFEDNFLTITDFIYVDFEYLQQDESEILWTDGTTKLQIPTSEQEIRIFKKRSDGTNYAWPNDYIGKLPMWLPPGTYSFLAFPCEDNLPLKPPIVINNVEFFGYSNLRGWDAPKPFKIFYKTKVAFDMKICNGVLFYGQSDKSGLTYLYKLNLNTLETDVVEFLIWLSTASYNRPLCLMVNGQNLIVGFKGGWSIQNIYSTIREIKVNSYNDIVFINQYLVDEDRKFYIKEVAKLGSDYIAILQSNDYPNLMETKYNIGGQVISSDIENPLVQTFPPNPPFYIDWRSASKDVYIFLAGKLEEPEDVLDTLNCFKVGDSVSVSSSGDLYGSYLSAISEILYQTITPKYWINRSRLTIFPPSNILTAYSKIYKSMGKLPARCKVKTSSGLEYENYTLVENEEFEVPVYGIVERSEPAKLKNKDVYRDSSFKIELESGVEIPTTDYTIREYMGTDKNETWIYFNPIYQGKKVLITYKYVDPEKIYSGFVLAHNKVYFTESKTNKLISYDGTIFKEEGLTYDETQPDYSVRTLTEQIKGNETGISSNLVYDSVRDRIYGITSPNDCVLFQYAKGIALYIPDCKFLGKNVLQVLGECARICNFVVYMDDEGILYFVPRDYNIRNFILTEEDIFSINSRMAAYEFGETYEKITVRFDGGEVVLGEGMLAYISGSEYISSRGWATVLATDLQSYFSTNPQIFTIVQKFVTGIRPLDMVLPIVTEKHISSMAIVQRVRIDQENQKVEITAREKK